MMYKSHFLVSPGFVVQRHKYVYYVVIQNKYKKHNCIQNLIIFHKVHGGVRFIIYRCISIN